MCSVGCIEKTRLSYEYSYSSRWMWWMAVTGKLVAAIFLFAEVVNWVVAVKWW